LARRPRLLARVALRRRRRDLVDVGEDRLGERVQRLGIDAALVPRLGEPAPRHPRARAIGREQRVERAAVARLRLPEALVHLAAAVALTWNDLVGPTDLAILAGLYLISAFGITIGYHRLLTHRSFDTPRPVRYALAIMGQTAVQGPVIDWVADHRKHHTFADEEGDPHSPHLHGGGFKGALHGLYHAHVGWLFLTQGQ